MLKSSYRLFVLLATLLATAVALSLALGPVSVSLHNIVNVVALSVGVDITLTPSLEQAQLIISQIRLPRALLEIGRASCRERV